MKIPVMITLEEAFEVTIKLFREEQDRREKFQQALEWIASHDCSQCEYKNFAKKCLDELKASR